MIICLERFIKSIDRNDRGSTGRVAYARAQILVVYKVQVECIVPGTSIVNITQSHIILYLVTACPLERACMKV